MPIKTKFLDSIKKLTVVRMVIVLLPLFSLLILTASPMPVSAATATCADGTTVEVTTPDSYERQCADKGGSSASESNTNGSGGTVIGEPVRQDCKGIDANNNPQELDKNNCKLVGYIIDIINVLSALVGVVVVMMIAIGGIQYSTSRDNPQAVQAAKSRIINALISLVAFLFLYSFLQWVVPGGIL